MIEHEIVDEFTASVDHYWETFFSDAYNDALWQALDIGREVLKFEREGEGQDEVIRRAQRLIPKRDVPAILRKVASGAISYEERNLWRRRDNAMEVETIPSFLADKFETKGVYRIEDLGNGKLRRTFKGHTTCRVALLGRKVEEHVAEEIRKSYRDTTAFTRKWLEQHPG